ncbi:WYL domain-containing transcriptional regulator [Paenibacillus tritici]|uniref:helix-turn-helix transcriptional regulator n=1 Tax=Paenibacillus tritici TaxID=1873425 RepID=UPI001BA53BA8|nr:WYL domain-containing transcriptional regulator [Paenibacillus tritici]QUL57448.1 WYL domain-containing transcriptional regulator [Paenibacillus tritici]
MSHIHRIQWFDQQIRNAKYPNSQSLAEQFEISRRQAQRDIEYLAESLRAPLRYVAKQRGYIYEDNSFVLPHLYITDEEQRILKYLAYRYSHYDYENARTIRKIGGLLERFTAQPNADKDIRLPVFEVDARLLQIIELLEQAVASRSVIHVLYQGQQDPPQELYLCPVKLSRRLDEDYLLAAIEGQEQPAFYMLSGIRQLKLTGRTFTAGEEEGSVSPPQQNRPPLKPFTARITLREAPADSSWGGYAVRAAGGDVYEIDFWDTEAFLGHLLRSDWTGILSPKWLKHKVRDRCRAVLTLLDEQENERENESNP